MSFKIAQISDMHCGDIRFDQKMLEGFIDKINSYNPDLVVVAGDLTSEGYKDQFLEAKGYIKKIKAKRVIVIAGNHDFKNVGYEYFAKYFGRTSTKMIIPKGKIRDFDQDVKIFAVDSNKPDIAEGEVGQYKYKSIESFYKDTKDDFTIFILHHHLISIPGTGLERNDVHDAGDVLKLVTDQKINLVLSGHKHVPHAWELDGVKLISSGTAGTKRTRGDIGPSMNLIEVTDKDIILTIYSKESSTVVKKMKRKS